PDAIARMGHDLRHAIALPWLEDGRGAERKEANDRAHLEPGGLAVGKTQHVVIEPVFFVPHAAAADAIERVGNGEEMVDEFHGHVIERGIFSGDLDRDFEHVLTKERHPGGSISLFEVASGSNWR